MSILIHRAEMRGISDFGWLRSSYSFSFAEYFNPLREKFFTLRVLNDEILRAGSGFSKTPYANIEMIYFPLKGELLINADNNIQHTIGTGEILAISAGKGVEISLSNPSEDSSLHLIQLWIYPEEKNKIPHFQKQSFNPVDRKNKLQLVASPDFNNNRLSIGQNSYISLLDLQKDNTYEYSWFVNDNKLLILVVEGQLQINSSYFALRRDTIEISDRLDRLILKGMTDCQLLIVETPED